MNVSGCYLSHLAVGQARLLQARRSIDALLADPTTPAELREQLELVGSVREFATQLGLEVGGQYTSFVAWPGDRIVTTVVATRPGEVEPAGFRFPLIGTLPYKGFFDPDRAEAEAGKLRAEGLDVCVFGVRAYSTLGWLDDPVTGPMLRRNPGELVETLLHELVHATVYVAEHIDFNEGVASFIGEEASVRFYRARNALADAERRRTEVADSRAIDVEMLRFRGAVAELYESGADSPQAERSELERDSRERIAALELESRDAAAIAPRLRLNDACLALAGTYASDVDRYAARLDALGGDLPRFVDLLRESAEADDPKAALLAD